jgi:rhodanese-related sulfurtransferase
MPRGRIKEILVEAFLVLLAGGVLALVANALSPRGLSLTKNYFPGSAPGSVSTPIPALPTAGSASTNETPAAVLLVERIKAEGLQVINQDQVVGLFTNNVSPGLIVFVDARDEEHYQQGHVPGAYELDPYHLEKYLGDVLPVCQTAGQIVVYCYGGDCEDSRFTAITLRNAGIPGEKLFIYTGGISEWTNNRLPVEIGERNSGNLHRPTP